LYNQLKLEEINMSSIQIVREGNHLSIASPYHPGLPAGAKKLGGKWNRGEKVWIFDIQDEALVRDLYLSIYGEWDEPMDLVTVQVTVSDKIKEYAGSIYFGGREITRAYGRDSGAKIGDGVIITSGGFTSGGSVKNWAAVIQSGSVFEVRKFPRAMAEKIIQDGWYGAEITILTGINRQSLKEERERLLNRIQEIDELLGGDA
jgi:hypothetical protein